MHRRTFLSAVPVFLAMANTVAAQAKLYRIGLLGATGRQRPGDDLFDAFVESLKELGYVEGQNIVVERRYGDGTEQQIQRLAAEIARLNVDVIVASATQPVHAVHRATSTIPIVMSNHSDPVGSGLVASLSRPGGNVTGLSILNPVLTSKRLDLLKAAISGLRRVAVLFNPTHQAHPAMLAEADVAARAGGLELHRYEARGRGEYDRAFSAMTRDRAQAVLVLGDVIFWSDRTRIAELAARQRLPTMFAQSEHVDAGGLLSYGADLRDNFRRAATYVAKILQGARPADLPIEQPTKFELVINMKTAGAIGLTIPTALLLRADRVVQ